MGMPPAVRQRGHGEMDSGPTARRRHRRRLLELSFVVGSFVAAGLVAAGVVAGADQPSIASDRSDYAPGNTVVLSGSGWAADETVHVVVDDDQSDAWSHEADVVAAADGTVSDSFDLPELAGTFAVTATATSGSASASFTVTAPTPPPPAPTGTPTLDSDEETYAPGDTVTLTGSDWQAGDTVHVAVNDDGSDAWDHSADVTVAADGTITDTFDLPDGLAAEFTATATDPTDRSATATFTAVSAPAGTPTLDSDEETYAPGDTVTLTGSDWQAGDTVHVAVNDDGSDAWDHSADVTVAADGTHHGHVRSSGRPRRGVHGHGHRSHRPERHGDVLRRIRLGDRALPRALRSGDVDRDAGADPRCSRSCETRTTSLRSASMASCSRAAQASRRRSTSCARTRA